MSFLLKSGFDKLVTVREPLSVVVVKGENDYRYAKDFTHQ